MFLRCDFCVCRAQKWSKKDNPEVISALAPYGTELRRLGLVDCHLVPITPFLDRCFSLLVVLNLVDSNLPGDLVLQDMPCLRFLDLSGKGSQGTLELKKMRMLRVLLFDNRR